MAPEQMMGKPQTGHADQYALGMVLYELLAGKHPFVGENFAEIAFQKASFDPENPNFPASVNSALRKAFSSNPQDRFRTCAEFLTALTAPAASLDTVLKSVSQKWKSWIWLPVLLLLFVFIFWGKAENPVEETVPHIPTRRAGERLVKTVNGIDYAFRWCPAGTFMMGSPTSESGRYDSETQHKVTLTRGFWMLETEVTQAMWKSVMGENPSNFQGDQNPVEQVSWNECQEFCRKLSSKLGGTVNLPTEAQWEYACRAGTTGPHAGNFDAMAWYWYNSGEKTHPVGQKQPNTWGLYDMHGNVWEWCLDWHDWDYYVESPTSDPLNSAGGSSRVYRGGGWDNSASYCRSAYRSGIASGYRVNFLGLRMVWQDSGE